MGRAKTHEQQKRLLSFLETYRKKTGLTQTELARRLGRPQSFVSKYEIGERRLDVVELLTIANALGVPEKKFLRDLLNHLGTAE
jgi:transcriptional regulator with XRE-family HTH domain